MFFVHAKLSDLALANLPKGVQSNDANRRSMVQSFALFDNHKFLTPLVIYYAHLHGRSAVGSLFTMIEPKAVRVRHGAALLARAAH